MSTETIIHTIRHARTTYNAEKRYAGSIDIPLSEAGIREAREAAPRLAGLKFDIVVVSTLKRALETAQLLVGESAPIVQSRLCNERSFGVMEGHTWEEILTFEPPIMLIDVGHDLHTVNPKGGEPFEVVWERAKKFRNLLFREHSGKKILVVSHGVFLQMFHGVLRGLSCIEALAVFPSSLELGVFRFAGKYLVEDKMSKLVGPDAIRF